MLDTLSQNSKIFIFQSDKKLSDSEIEVIDNRLKDFMRQWRSHGNRLKAECFVSSPLFVVIGVDESLAELSGCSKDAMTHEIKSIGDEISVDFFNRLNTAYLTKDGELNLVNMSEFKTLAKMDEIGLDTVVYNNLIEVKSELKDQWIVAIKNSWHMNMMSIL